MKNDPNWNPESSPVVAAWENYREEIYPEGLSPVQEKECSQAFYAGMLMGYKELISLGDQEQEEGEALLREFEFDLKEAAFNVEKIYEEAIRSQP